MKWLNIICSLVIAFTGSLFGQKLLPAWEVKLDFYPKKLQTHDYSGNWYLVSDDEHIAALNGTDGSVAWSYTFQDKFGIKEFDYQLWNKNEKVILLANEDKKEVLSEKIFISSETGDELWRTKRPLKYDKYSLATAFSSIYFESQKAFPVYDGKTLELVEVKTGKSVWTNSGYGSNAKFNIWLIGGRLAVVCGNNVYRLRTDYLDPHTGTFLDSVSNDMGVKRKKFHGPVTIKDQPSEIEITYDNKENSVGGDSRVLKVTARNVDTKNIIWQSEVKAEIVGGITTKTKIEKKINTINNNFMSLFGSRSITDESIDDLLDLRLFNHYLLIVYQGISVLDVTDGSMKWSMELKTSDGSVFPVKSVTYDVGSITADDSCLYLTDLKEKNIKKVDIRSGQILWQSDKLKMDEIIPAMVVYKGKLITQTGGRVLYQSEITKSYGLGGQFLTGAAALNPFYTTTYYEHEYKFKGNNHNLSAYDINTGKKLWTASIEKSPKIASMLFRDSVIYLATKKFVYIISAESGSILKQADMKPAGIGDVFQVIPDTGWSKLYIHGEKGLATLKSDDLSQVFAVNTKNNVGFFTLANRYFIWTGKKSSELKNFITIDLANGKTGDSFELPEAVDDPTTYMTEDGTAVFIRKERKILKYIIK